jgi:YidC/Oxa1 family membrane protein insertase
VLAFNLLQPVTNAMLSLLNGIHTLIPSYGLDMILIALVVRLAMWPLAQQQFKSMAEMQKLQPLLKGLQAKYKGNPQEQQAATMALYKEHGVNPLAGCFPMLIQLPVLFGLYWAINSQIDHFKTQHFLWIGSPISDAFPQIFATSLAVLDIPLFLLYIVSMYISVRYGSPPSTDPQQAQTQKIMAYVSPAMIAYIGLRYHWASALILYWLSINIFTMGQQLFLYRRYGLIGPKSPAALAARADAASRPASAVAKNASLPKNEAAKNGGNGQSRNGRAKKRSLKR